MTPSFKPTAGHWMSGVNYYLPRKRVVPLRISSSTGLTVKGKTFERDDRYGRQRITQMSSYEDSTIRDSRDHGQRFQSRLTGG
jgi:hypothetical protein